MSNQVPTHKITLENLEDMERAYKNLQKDLLDFYQKEAYRIKGQDNRWLAAQVYYAKKTKLLDYPPFDTMNILEDKIV